VILPHKREAADESDPTDHSAGPKRGIAKERECNASRGGRKTEISCKGAVSEGMEPC